MSGGIYVKRSAHRIIMIKTRTYIVLNEVCNASSLRQGIKENIQYIAREANISRKVNSI